MPDEPPTDDPDDESETPTMQIGALSAAITVNIDFPTPTQDLAIAIANTPTLSSPALKRLADENFASIMGTHALGDLSTTLAALDQLEALTRYPEAGAIASMPTASLQPSINALTALSDLPDEVFSTAVAASTVSARARTSTSASASVSRTEAATTTTYNNFDAEAPQSLFINTAFAIGSYVSYLFEGLSQKQRAAATTAIAAGIASGTAHQSPMISETPFIAGTSTITLGLLVQQFLLTADEEET